MQTGSEVKLRKRPGPGKSLIFRPGPAGLYRWEPHVNTKRKIDALKRGLTIKRVETRFKMFSRRMQTRFDMKRIDTRLKIF